ncbi:Os02g0245200 [Oryza sativa Japonica Group]|uniref:Os02g0245200 protein n=1 Tax=Oryza sativa subsp. japonica TaxID=39947 RepID=A0A0P0VGX3_ORYSJ|nr:Os02g0245200 [Oryza sativa Japonica Group]
MQIVLHISSFVKEHVLVSISSRTCLPCVCENAFKQFVPSVILILVHILVGTPIICNTKYILDRPDIHRDG